VETGTINQRIVNSAVDFPGRTAILVEFNHNCLAQDYLRRERQIYASKLLSDVIGRSDRWS
jgi:hypothetical protein